MNKVASASNLRASPANRASRRRTVYSWGLAVIVVLILGSMLRSGVQPRQPTLVRGHTEVAAEGEDGPEQTAASKQDTASGATTSETDDDGVDAEAVALALEEDEEEQEGEQEKEAEQEEAAVVQPAAEQRQQQDPPEGAAAAEPLLEEPGGEEAKVSDAAASPSPEASAAGPATEEGEAEEEEEEEKEEEKEAQAPASEHEPAAGEQEAAPEAHREAAAGSEGGEEGAATTAPQQTTPADSPGGGGQEAAAPPRALPGDAVPKVALMFLSRGWLPHKTVWHEWMKGVDGGVLPVPALARLGCSQEQVELVQGMDEGGAVQQEERKGKKEEEEEGEDEDEGESGKENGEEEKGEAAEGGGEKEAGGGGGSSSANSTLYQRQRLFNIYVHAPPSYTVQFDNDSVFHGREAKQRVATKWGTHSLVTAVRHMVAEALQDPANQRFMLMSEGDIPLWPPGLIYLQLMAEPASRIKACAPRTAAEDKGRDDWQADFVHVPRKEWRKSSQWFAINRRHAEVFAAESELDAVFDKECFVRKDMVNWKSRPDDRWCVSDEHYLPTVLAAVSQESEFSCNYTADGEPATSPTYTQWGSSPHPKTFSAAELQENNYAALHSARRAEPEVAQAALEEYASWLVQPRAWTQQACRRAVKRLAARAARSTANSTAAAAPAAAAPAQGAAETPAAAAAREWPLTLMPPYMPFLTMRKIHPGAAQPLVDAIAEGLLEAADL